LGKALPRRKVYEDGEARSVRRRNSEAPIERAIIRAI